MHQCYFWLIITTVPTASIYEVFRKVKNDQKKCHFLYLSVTNLFSGNQDSAGYYCNNTIVTLATIKR